VYSPFAGLLSAGLFATTLSFMVSTPASFVPEVGFSAISVARAVPAQGHRPARPLLASPSTRSRRSVTPRTSPTFGL
jgi:hypothetical protein